MDAALVVLVPVFVPLPAAVPLALVVPLVVSPRLSSPPPPSSLPLSPPRCPPLSLSPPVVVPPSGHSSHGPPHEQSLVRLGAGGVFPRHGGPPLLSSWCSPSRHRGPPLSSWSPPSRHGPPLSLSRCPLVVPWFLLSPRCLIIPPTAHPTSSRS